MLNYIISYSSYRTFWNHWAHDPNWNPIIILKSHYYLYLLNLIMCFSIENSICKVLLKQHRKNHSPIFFYYYEGCGSYHTLLQVEFPTWSALPYRSYSRQYYYWMAGLQITYREKLKKGLMIFQPGFLWNLFLFIILWASGKWRHLES